ncbi:unnamed protein product [Rotaria magnacalcarata]|uniref:HEAT repeat-containing protein 1 n=1 Tax=Rotaria magnacalcarata TaxID=392030 RepID=A0A816SN43_9BILA|nr:unnamed protein product [Rotaria magnacalcarata]CAF3895362.1 unnamed protein product [Rotaria magnacalcarata]
MTSLKLQLSKLADAHTQWQLTDSENRKRASFLYDPKVASTLDRETIYCLGANGFEELCLLDSGFEEFERVLFSDTSLTFERSIQTKEVNDSLNQTIRRFLIRLSPYFLLSPAHKALEWLVHRFFIHFYNVDDLIRCILPYHEHNYFTRAVQMLRLSDKQSTWIWLESAQKAGTTIPGLVMANRCATDLGFFNFICDSVAMAVQEFGSSHSSLRVIMNFYLKTICSTILHSLSHKKKKKKKNSNEENFIAQFMPYLLKGLKSKCLDYKRATYLILSNLSNIFTFQTNIKDEILNVTSKGFSDDLIKENLLIISVFLNNQHHQSVPDRCFLKLCQLSNVAEEIFQLTNEVRIDNFLCGWFEQLLNHVLKDNHQMETDHEENFTSLIEKTLNTIKFNSAILTFIINCFIKQFNSKNNTYIVSLASIIERKYPIDFDDNIRQQTESCSTDEERKRIREFASMTAIGFKHQPLSDRGSLAICLNHPQAQLRIEALQRIREGIMAKQNIETEFLIDVLTSRLNDNEITVVHEALHLLEELQLTDNQQINDILQKLLQRENEDWSSVQQSIVRLLTLDPSSENKYLHLLFPTTSSELNLLNNLLENYKQKQTSSPLLKLAKKNFKSTTVDSLSTAIARFIQSIPISDDQSNILLPLLRQSDEILRLVEHFRPNWVKFAIIYVLLGIETIKQHANNEYNQLATIIVFKLLKSLSKEISPINAESTELTESKTLIDLHVIKKVPLTKTSYDFLWKLYIQALPKDNSQSSFTNGFLCECIQWLCSEEKISHLHLLFNEQFPLLNKLVLFLAEYYLNINEKNHEQELILKYIVKQSHTTEYTNLSIIILSFCLHSTYRPIRSSTLKIFQTKLKCSTNDFDAFIQSIKHHENEILTDSEYICYLISQLIQSIKLNEKKKRKLNSDSSSLISLFKITIDSNEDLNHKLKQQLNIHLLYLLKQCKHWSVFNEYRIDMENLLQLSEQNLAVHHNKIFIENIIHHMDYETLIHEQSFCFEIILQILKRSIKKSKALITIDIMTLALKQFTPEMFSSLSSDFEKQIQLIDECFSLWQRSKSAQLTSTIKTTLSKFNFDAKHFLTYWKTILEPNNQENTSNVQQNRLSNKKLIVSKTNESAPTNPINISISWKSLIASLELLHNDQLLITNRHELIRPLFVMLEKSLNQTEEFEQKTYIHQLCSTALLNLYTQLKSDECNPDIFNSEVVMECMRRTNDLHTTQQCLMLLSKGAQLFPEKLISMIMAMFAFVGDRLVRKDDLYSYQVMEKTIKTVIPSLYKEKNAEQRRPILAKITHVFVTSLAHLPAHRRQDIFRMLMESIGQDECLWFAPIQLFDSVLLSPINRKNEETLKKSLIEANEQMLSGFNQFPTSTILISVTRILNILLNLPDQITKHQSTPSTYSHLIDLRLYTTKHIHVFKYQLLAFVNNVLSADFFIKMIKRGLHQENELNYLNELIQTILHCLLWANKLSEDDVDITRYNKSILNKIYDCLNKSIALLNGSMFANIISNLLQQQQTNDKLQRKTLEILNNRLKDEFTPENELVLFLPHMDGLLSIINKYSTHEQEQTAQTALFSIKLLAKRLAEKHPTEFSSVSFNNFSNINRANDLKSSITVP